MLRTQICRIFNLEFPIVQGGMLWCAGWRLASSVSNAGGLGLIGAASMTPEVLRQQIIKTRENCDRPFGVNFPIFLRHAEEIIKVLEEENIKIIFTSGGSPAKYTSRFKSWGAKVAHVCSTPGQAEKCQLAGCDAVVVEGFEAGGHNGRDELTTMVLVPQAVDAVDIPVIAAGGIVDGRSMAAAIMLGAEGVQVGTRFVASREASCNECFKEAVLNCKAEDTRLILKKLVPTRVIVNDFARRAIEAEDSGADKEKLSEILGRGRAKTGMAEGDLKDGELEIGQAAALINNIYPAAWIVREMAMECRRTISSMF